MLPPTARFFAPRLIVPAPSIEPAVMPAFVSKDRSMKPAAPLMKRAVPPVLVMVALPPSITMPAPLN